MVSGRFRWRSPFPRLPFFWFLQGSIVLLALALGLFDSETGARWVERAGFGWPALREGRWWTLVGSTFLVDSFSQYLRIALLLTWTVGALEWLTGTRRTLLVYVLSTVLSASLAALVQGAAGRWWGAGAFADTLDVGASAGAFGCAGALLAWPASRRVRGRLLGLLVVGLAAKAVLFSSPLADVTHWIALAVGWGAAVRRGSREAGGDAPGPRGRAS